MERLIAAQQSENCFLLWIALLLLLLLLMSVD